ncbi:F0F1 ATP synthase subunit B [Buchnera aphidicola]|uniref:F0F1 ATP synthase subunit B n=1 Tax=Buchnera aphidicola TaxID=9 RepID=UPI0034642D46
MDLNATIFGQSISFILFIWFCMKYVWPKLISTIEIRKKKIIHEFCTIEKSKKKIHLMKIESQNILDISKKQALEIIENAKNEKALILEKAKILAQNEKKKIILQAHEDIKIKTIKIRDDLIKEISYLASIMAQKLIHDAIKKENTQYNIDHIINHL